MRPVGLSDRPTAFVTKIAGRCTVYMVKKFFSPHRSVMGWPYKQKCRESKMHTIGLSLGPQMTMLEGYRSSGRTSSRANTSHVTSPYSRDTTRTANGTATSDLAQNGAITPTINGGRNTQQSSKPQPSKCITTTTFSDSLEDTVQKQKKETEKSSQEKALLTNNSPTDSRFMREEEENKESKSSQKDTITSTQTNSRSLLGHTWQSSTVKKDKQLLALLPMVGRLRGRKMASKKCINNCTQIDKDTNQPCKKVHQCCPWTHDGCEGECNMYINHYHIE